MVSLEIDQFIKRTDTTRVKIADAMTKNVNNKARFDKIILARQELGQTQGAQAKIFDNAASLDDEIKQLSKKKKEDEEQYRRIYKSYKKYSLFFEDTKISRLSQLGNLYFIFRRCVFIASAIFLQEDYLFIAMFLYLMLSYT